MFRPGKRVEGAHRDGIWTVCWLDEMIITGSLDGTAKLWKDDCSLVSTSSEQKLGISSVASANNESIKKAITCCQDSIIRIYDVPDMKETAVIDPGLFEASTLSISPCGNVSSF